MSNYNGKTAITFGVFDLLHFGHFELFRRIKELVGECGKVFVMLQIDEMIAKYKPGCKNVYDFATRQKMIESLRAVDKAIAYDVVGVEAVKDVDFDVLVVGPEHTNERFQRLFNGVLKMTRKLSLYLERKVYLLQHLRQSLKIYKKE